MRMLFANDGSDLTAYTRHNLVLANRAGGQARQFSERRDTGNFRLPGLRGRIMSKLILASPAGELLLRAALH